MTDEAPHLRLVEPSDNAISEEWPWERDMELGKPHGDVAGQNDLARFKEPPAYKPTETDRFMLRLSELCGEALETARKKNADYANTDDPFANFRSSEEIDVPLEKGIAVRMGDKWKRFTNLMRRPAQVKNESIEDTLLDLAVYSLILRVYLEGKR